MAQTYLVFDFGSDEAKVQQARHKLDGWRQAFRLDKKLQFKFDRSETRGPETEAKSPEVAAESPKAKTGKAKTKSKPAESSPGTPNGDVKLVVRLYFSPHEKLSEQRWIERIPAEEPFKGASPKVVHEGTAGFSDVLNRFDSLD
jgi:hypothetical protein